MVKKKKKKSGGKKFLVVDKHVPRSRDFDQNFGVQITKIKGVWGAFLGVFVDRIVRFGAIAESDGVILEKWTKFY